MFVREVREASNENQKPKSKTQKVIRVGVTHKEEGSKTKKQNPKAKRALPEEVCPIKTKKQKGKPKTKTRERGGKPRKENQKANPRSSS